MSAGDDLGDAPSFREYMQRCLYDPSFGYYACGRVRFETMSGHFWTWPQRLSPLFGWMMADALRFLLERLLDNVSIPSDRPITILELGGGDGDLARDILDRVEQLAAAPDWRHIAPRVRYVVGEKSAALRARQREKLARHISAGRAAVRDMDATAFAWDGPFTGAVICNELLDAFPCERFHIAGPDDALRIHVRGTAPGGGVLGANELWQTIAAGGALHLESVAVPVAASWGGAPPAWLVAYLEAIRPLVQDLATCDLLPTALHAAPGVVGFTQSLGRLLAGPERNGVALIIDYGGTSRHVLDPRSAAPHLRVYSGDRTIDRTCSPYVTPGALDMTWDVDFTELSRLAEEAGLVLHHFAHQSILEASTVDLWSPELRPLVIAGRLDEGYPEDEAEEQAEYTVFRFREASGFRTAIIAPPGYCVPLDRFGGSDRATGSGLDTVARSVEPDAIARALPDLERPGDWLLPCCDVVANLSDHRSYAAREEVLRTLRERGWLVPPGAI